MGTRLREGGTSDIGVFVRGGLRLDTSFCGWRRACADRHEGFGHSKGDAADQGPGERGAERAGTLGWWLGPLWGDRAPCWGPRAVDPRRSQHGGHRGRRMGRPVFGPGLLVLAGTAERDLLSKERDNLCGSEGRSTGPRRGSEP